MKGPRGALFYVGPRFGPFVCNCWKKINNMLLCVKIMLICDCVMYYHGNGDEWKLYVGNIIIQNL